MPQEKENENENEAPRIPGAFRPGDPVPVQPTLPTAGKTVDDEPEHDKARESETGTHVDPMRSSDLGDKPREKDDHKARATRDDSHKSHR